MIRSVASIARAIEIAWPLFTGSPDGAAAHIRKLAIQNDFDPLTMVALVERESKGNVHAIGSANEIGLAQIQPRNNPVCREAPTSDLCVSYKHKLHDWAFNLTIAAGYFRAMREYCRKRVGSALAVHWFGIYDGTDANRGRTCNHRKVRGKWVAQPATKLSQRLLARRRELERLVSS